MRLRLSAPSFFVIVFAFLAFATSAWARVDLLLVPPADPISASAGSVLTLYANNPTTEPDAVVRLPKSATAMYATERWRGQVQFEVLWDKATDGDIVEIKLGAMTSRKITLRLLDPLPVTSGFVSLRFVNPETNTIMFEVVGTSPTPVAAPPVAAQESVKKSEQARSLPNREGDIDLRTDVEGVRRHISGYDPIYFVVGARARINARFQFSFKYRLLEAQADQEIKRDLYFAYTQTSIWDLESLSKPFYDSSYKPTAFFLRERFRETGFWSHIGLQIGAQHESNGKGGGTVAPSSGLISGTSTLLHPNDTRSLNTLYIAPRFRWNHPATGWFLEVSPRVMSYFQIDENPDLPRYRGHVELSVHGGYDRAGQISMLLRGSPRGKGSVEFNATWPMTRIVPLSWLSSSAIRDVIRSGGGYFQLQYFNGYGESLLDYDVRRKDQLRFGIEIVR